jgi:hypothetical protein
VSVQFAIVLCRKLVFASCRVMRLFVMWRCMRYCGMVLILRSFCFWFLVLARVRCSVLRFIDNQSVDVAEWVSLVVV